MNPPVGPDETQSDIWSDWILHRRYGGDPDRASHVTKAVKSYCDRVLDGALLGPNLVLLDIGSGDGVVAFGAIERIGSSLKAILADISPVLLAHAEQLAIQKGIREQCSFVHTQADRLEGVEDASVDVVTTRSVLAYVEDKAAAARSIFRVLSPGGRVSLAEPIYRDEALQLATFSRFLDSQGQTPELENMRLVHRCRAQVMPANSAAIQQSPLTNFTERNLVEFFQQAGFQELHLELHIDVRRVPASSWESFINVSPRPGAPTLREVLAHQFTVAEAQQVTALMRPAVEAGQYTSREMMAYLTAQKPRERR